MRTRVLMRGPSSGFAFRRSKANRWRKAPPSQSWLVEGQSFSQSTHKNMPRLAITVRNVNLMARPQTPLVELAQS